MKKNKKWIGFIAALLFSFVFVVIIKWWQNTNPFDMATAIWTVTNLLSVLITAGFFNKILTNNSTLSIAQLKKRLVPSFILFVFATLLICLFLYSLGSYVNYRISGRDTALFLEHLIQVEFPGALKSLLVFIFFAPLIFFYATWSQAVKREQQLREENLKYKYRTLKTQVNPHFLFNSLNTLSEVVYVDAKKADHYIQKLAGIYRYILDHEETDLIPLDEEIEFVKHYFDLQKERAEDKITLDICLENTNRFKIIPISLQLLVENALKHNSASIENPLKIRINQMEEYVIISNTIRKKALLNASSGTGLSNLKERVKLMTGKEMIVSRENNQFVVQLPIISSEK